MITTARAMSTALPVSGSVDNALLIATAPMPPSPITRAAMRAALPEMARAPASRVCGAAGGEQGLQKDRVRGGARRQRDEHRVDQQLGVEAAARRGPDRLRHGDEEADIAAQVARVRKRGVRQRDAADQDVIAPDQLPREKQDAARADPQPGAPLIARRVLARGDGATRDGVHRRPRPGRTGHERPAVRGRNQIGQDDREERSGGDRHQRASLPGEGSHKRPWANLIVRARGREGVKFRGRMDRLAWRTAPRASLAQWDDLVRFADAARRDGLNRTVVCGMGGSSLAPEVLASSFANPSLSVLDSTDPSALLAVARARDFDRTLFVVCSKSGSTVETLAFYHYLAARADAGHFVAITEPGSPLEALARDRGFRAVFPHPPDVGGRYAALTVVGMLPAALLGVNGRGLLERALAVDADAARARGARIAEEALTARGKLALPPPRPGNSLPARA